MNEPMPESEPLDEMVDGAHHVRPHWRGVFGSIFSLGHDTLTERAQLLERAFVEEGITAMLPGEQPVNWRCDPIPLILSAEEFAGLEIGLAQRARLIDAILADVYGQGNLVETGQSRRTWFTAIRRSCGRAGSPVPTLHHPGICMFTRRI